MIHHVKNKVIDDDEKKLTASGTLRKFKESKNINNHVHATSDEFVTVEGTTNPFAGIPGFRDVPSRDHAQLFRLKLNACRTIYDFSTNCFAKEKEQKRQTLVEMVQFLGETKGCLNEGLMQDLVFMTSINIFRSLPARRRCIGPVFDPESEDAQPDEAWAHLQVVYELFLRFLASNDVDAKVAKQYVDGNFILNLLELFDSEDSRERDYVKNILHRAYGKFMTLRSFVRKAITYVFFRAIYEREFHNGVGELLELLGSIINGFALPLKQEHRDFLIRGLIPLHKVKHVMSFHQQLSYCMLQYAEKDQRLTVDIIQTLLAFWPTTCAAKQILFLSELEEMLDLMQPVEFLKMRDAIFARIKQCIVSLNYQVSERALNLWNNDNFTKLVTDHRKVLYPVIVPALCDNSQHHWNPTIQWLTVSVLKTLSEADRELLDKCSSAHNQEVEKKLKKRAQVSSGHASIWASLLKEYNKGVSRGRKLAEPIEVKTDVPRRITKPRHPSRETDSFSLRNAPPADQKQSRKRSVAKASDL